MPTQSKCIQCLKESSHIGIRKLLAALGQHENWISQDKAIENAPQPLKYHSNPYHQEQEGFSKVFDPGLSDTGDEVADTPIVFRDLGTKEQANDMFLS